MGFWFSTATLRPFLLGAFAVALCFAGTAAFASSSSQGEEELSTLFKADVHAEPATLEASNKQPVNNDDDKSYDDGNNSATPDGGAAFFVYDDGSNSPTADGGVAFYAYKGPDSYTKTLKPGATVEVYLHSSAGTAYEWKVVKKDDVSVSDITVHYNYTENPKLRGITGGPMTYKATVTAPEKPGSYSVEFAFASDFDTALRRVLKVEVTDDNNDDNSRSLSAVDEDDAVAFYASKGPNSYTKTLKPGATVEVYLYNSAGTAYEWKVLKKGDVSVSTITPSTPKHNGMPGSSVTYKATVTAPEKPGSYSVEFAFASDFEMKARRVLKVEVTDDNC